MKNERMCYVIDSDKNLFTIKEKSILGAKLDIKGQVYNDNNEELMYELENIFPVDKNATDYELKLERIILNALDKIKELSNEDFDYVDTLCDLANEEIITHSECLNILDRGNYSKEIVDNLNAIKEGKTDYNYDLETDFGDFSNYIRIGKDYTERLQIFIMCYVADVKLKELETWNLHNIVEYIKETDEYFEEDKKYIIECLDLIDNEWTSNEDLRKIMGV